MSQDNNLKLEVGLLSVCGSIISDSHVLSCQHVPLISRYACFCSRVDLKKKKKKSIGLSVIYLNVLIIF